MLIAPFQISDKGQMLVVICQVGMGWTIFITKKKQQDGSVIEACTFFCLSMSAQYPYKVQIPAAQAVWLTVNCPKALTV